MIVESRPARGRLQRPLQTPPRGYRPPREPQITISEGGLLGPGCSHSSAATSSWCTRLRSRRRRSPSCSRIPPAASSAGHTHEQELRDLGDVVVLNGGTVGGAGGQLREDHPFVGGADLHGRRRSDPGRRHGHDRPRRQLGVRETQDLDVPCSSQTGGQGGPGPSSTAITLSATLPRHPRARWRWPSRWGREDHLLQLEQRAHLRIALVDVERRRAASSSASGPESTRGVSPRLAIGARGGVHDVPPPRRSARRPRGSAPSRPSVRHGRAAQPPQPPSSRGGSTAKPRPSPLGARGPCRVTPATSRRFAASRHIHVVVADREVGDHRAALSPATRAAPRRPHRGVSHQRAGARTGGWLASSPTRRSVSEQAPACSAVAAGACAELGTSPRSAAVHADVARQSRATCATA